jgi:hypothetical protein
VIDRLICVSCIFPGRSALEATDPLPEDAVTHMFVLHESARKAMKGVFKALWPEEEHVERLKRARCQIQTCKISACREGVRQSWAMVKMRYTGVDIVHLAEVGPIGADGEEIPTSLVYENVMPAARFSQKDCALDALIDGMDLV